jgi:hypothetical protein
MIFVLVSVIVLVFYSIDKKSPIERLNRIYDLNLSKESVVIKWDEQWYANGDGYIKGVLKLTKNQCKQIKKGKIKIEKKSFGISNMFKKYNLEIKDILVLKKSVNVSEKTKMFLVLTKDSKCFLYYDLSIF